MKNFEDLLKEDEIEIQRLLDRIYKESASIRKVEMLGDACKKTVLELVGYCEGFEDIDRVSGVSIDKLQKLTEEISERKIPCENREYCLEILVNIIEKSDDIFNRRLCNVLTRF